MFSSDIEALARLVLNKARERGIRIAVAESCTGGLLSAVLTSIPGSSDVFDRGFITYSNRAKEEMLGIPGDLIADMGAVSETVARRMAEGALAASGAQLAAAVTGVAGPGGGTPMKPVGTVHFATAGGGGVVRHRAEHFEGQDRQSVQISAVRVALEMLREGLD